MYGSIIGDMVGSPYEFAGIKTTDFVFINEKSLFTDDSVMTVAIAEALMNAGHDADLDVIRKSIIESMVRLGRMFPSAGYGSSFLEWIFKRNPQPYGSYGNGSAMRVGTIASFYPNDLQRALFVAKISAEVSHNHPEAIKAAECTTEMIWLSNKGIEKDEIRKIVEEKYYILDKSCDEIRQDYKFDVSCQGTMPAAIQCFFEGNNYEEVVRLAVSLGGDADTLACISGSIAEAYYGVPEHLKKRCRQNLKEQNATSLLNIIERYEYYMKALENEEVIVIPKKPDRKRVHNMTIQDDDSFSEVATGVRIYEIRMCDSKRKEIQPDDYITFKCGKTEKKCIAKVKSLHVYSNIFELNRKENVNARYIKEVMKYYTKEELVKKPFMMIKLFN